MNQLANTQNNQLAANAENERQKKEMEALIDTVLLSEPGLKGRLNMQVVWNYLQLPDSSFGWTDGWKGDMPWRVKMLAVAAHLKEGATPGFGQIYYLGNKLYKAADFVRGKANKDKDFVIMGNPVWKPHTQEERGMFGLEDGDMSCRLAMTVKWKGEIVQLVGDGILGKDELDKRDKKGKPLPGRDTKKNIAGTLKTRAMRDMYKYFYPSDLPIGGDRAEEIEIVEAERTELQQLEMPRDEFDLAKTREKIKDENENKNRQDELEQIKDKLARLHELGLNIKEVSEMTGKNWNEIIKGTSTDYAYNTAISVLSDLIINRQVHVKKSKAKKTRTRKAKTEVKTEVNENNIHKHTEAIQNDAPPSTAKTATQRQVLKDDDPVEAFIDDIQDAEATFEDPTQEIPQELQDSYDACDELIEHDNVTDPVVTDILVKLKRCKLEAGDRLKLYNSVQSAVFNKDFGELNALLQARNNRLA